MKITTHFCKTSDLGTSGTLFGGQLMYWLDEAAAVYAIRAMGQRRVVTKRFSEAVFQKPIYQDELVEFYCVDPKPGNTSLSFRVLVKVGDEIRFQTECTFVAVDEQGRKKPVDWAESPLMKGLLSD